MAKAFGRSGVTSGLLVMTLFLGSLVAAHEGHRSPTPTPSPSASPALVVSPAAEAPVVTLAPVADSEPTTEEDAFPAIPVRAALLDHMHNKIVHFPLALGVAAAILILIAPRWPAYGPAGRLLLIGAALGAVGAYFSGQAQHDAFEEGPIYQVMKVHRVMGVATGVSLWLGVALSFWAAARRWLPLYAIYLLVVLSVTGFLGGILSHGPVQ